jgi:adenine-specific DNA-methyltransferase
VAGAVNEVVPEDSRASVIAKKRLGMYYSPDGLTDTISRWAVRSRSDRVLEPSFGGCGFLSSIAKTLEELGCEDPARQLFGCDIDPGSQSHLVAFVGHSPKALQNFAFGDFLTLENDRFPGGLFDVVLGNPPYVSHHNAEKAQKLRGRRLAKTADCSLPATASMWAYFLLHSLSFLKKGGRIGMILPASFLTSEYADGIKRRIGASFRRALAVLVRTRLFRHEGTEERTVVLVADGYADGCSEGLKVADVSDERDLKRTLSGWSEGRLSLSSLTRRLGYCLLDAKTLSMIDEIGAEESTHFLGDLADLRIGLVTGANSFFVIDRATAERHHLWPDCVLPVLSKMRDASGLVYSYRDHLRSLGRQRRCLIVGAPKPNIPKASRYFREYTRGFAESRRKANVTFNKRDPWHAVDDRKVPDAFLSYMHHEGPRLVLNSANINCTNSIHRVYFSQVVTPLQRKLSSLSILSTFSQVIAELEGRAYGGGILKHEIREARRLALLLPSECSVQDIREAWRSANDALKAGNPLRARAIADELVLKPVLGQFYSQRLATLKVVLSSLRTARFCPLDSVKMSV